MENLISVIIPVYNVEKYLDKCFETLLNQTYNNIEFIFVNDCSTDNSEKIIKTYQKQDQRIIYLKNKTNKGAGYSRNQGLDKAKGEYIGFIDPDDYISLNFYEKLITEMIKEKSDLGITDIKVTYEDTKEEITAKAYDKELTKLNIVNTGLAASSCNKLFKKELIKQYKYEVGKMNEDVAVVIPAIINAKKITYCEDVYYYYLQRGNSTQNASLNEKKFDAFDIMDITLNRIKDTKDYKNYKESLVFQQLISFFLYVIPKEKNIIKRYSYLKRWLKKLKKYNYKQNKHFWYFMDTRTKKELIYYKLLTCNNYFISNLSITAYKTYRFLRDNTAKNIIKQNITMDDLIKITKKNQKQKESISISVVVPNYNYEKFMYERIYSILNQKVKITELLILDDCSKDNSREMIDDIEKHLKPHINIKKIYNETNSGSAFKQWEKGMNLANCDYVWIAEADDYSDKNFLKEVTKPILKNKNIIISYVDTSFIDAKGKTILKTIKNEIDIRNTKHWDKSYVNNGKKEFKEYTYLNCTIANVSSVIFKKDNYDEIFKLAGTFKQAGDWLFYASLYQLGDVSFIAKQYNYYRVHGNNVTSTTKKEAHLNEIKKIHKHYEEKYGLNQKQKQEINKRYKFLNKVWELE